LSLEVGNYNVPFLYLLDIATFLPGPGFFKIKIICIAFDVVLAFFAYKIVRLARPRGPLPLLAALIVVFLPTVVINASFWTQIDAMWASLALGGVYFLLRGRYWWGVSLCTVSLAVKPQGIFIFPLVGLLVLAGRIPWRSLLAVPLVYLALDLPALLAGRNAWELLTIYSLDRQGKWVNEHLTWGAASVYAFVPTGFSGERGDSIRNVGYALCAALILGVCYVLVVRKVELTRERLVTIATLFAIMMPFFMPGMHERYFFLADAMSVVLVFVRPRLWYVALLVPSSSLLAYESFLFGRQPETLPLVIPATMMLTALIVVAYQVFRDAVPEPTRPELAAAVGDKPAGTDVNGHAPSPQSASLEADDAPIPPTRLITADAAIKTS
jgi:Gpi18-like mannosyltransferase